VMQPDVSSPQDGQRRFPASTPHLALPPWAGLRHFPTSTLQFFKLHFRCSSWATRMQLARTEHWNIG
jgi:hypothetical protein